MLKETKTEETLGFFISFLSLATFQLRGPAPWLGLSMIAPSNHVVALAPGTLGIFATPSCQI